MTVFPVSSDVHVAAHAVFIVDVPTMPHEFDAMVPVVYVPLSSFDIFEGIV